jgi:hypothetical protein
VAVEYVESSVGSEAVAIAVRLADAGRGTNGGHLEMATAAPWWTRAAGACQPTAPGNLHSAPIGAAPGDCGAGCTCRMHDAPRSAPSASIGASCRFSTAAPAPAPPLTGADRAATTSTTCQRRRQAGTVADRACPTCLGCHGPDCRCQMAGHAWSAGTASSGAGNDSSPFPRCPPFGPRAVAQPGATRAGDQPRGPVDEQPPPTPAPAARTERARAPRAGCRARTRSRPSPSPAARPRCPEA